MTIDKYAGTLAGVARYSLDSWRADRDEGWDAPKATKVGRASRMAVYASILFLITRRRIATDETLVAEIVDTIR